MLVTGITLYGTKSGTCKGQKRLSVLPLTDIMIFLGS